MCIAIAETDKVSKYRLGHRTADFYVCRNWGAVPVVTSEIDGTTIGLVDVRMIENFPGLAGMPDRMITRASRLTPGWPGARAIEGEP